MNDILFGNNNKAVIKKLANRSFRSNKMRNVIAAIAIALTTFLFTAVLTIGMGASGTLEYSMAKMMGSSADALVQGLSEDQFQQLKENAMFEKVGCWVPIEIMTNTNRMVAEIDYADQPQLELRMQTPRTGSAPQKANEVLVSANILKDLNIEEKIGAEIPIEFKNRQSGQMYHFDMIVSGIYNTPNEKSESVIVSKAFMEKNPEMMREIAQGREGCGIYDADVIMRDSSMVKERISEFVRSIGGNPDDRSAENYVRVAPNTFLSNNSGGSIMWLVAGVFGVLFMFCGYLLIYNVFEIAVTNDIRQYGLLRTVGTTSQQIKRLVNRQALYLFLIGTPLGLFFGTLLGRSILPVALQIFAVDFSGGNIEVGTLPYLGIIAGAILFSGLTVYISTRKSVKKASRVSPIESIRYVEQDMVSIKRKKTASGSVIPRMAKANLQRNKRRTVFIVISLTLSIVFLNSVFIFSSSFDEDAYIANQTRSDFIVYSPVIQAAWGDNFGHDSAVPEKAVEEIKEQPGVTNEAYLYRNTFEDDHISCDWGTPYVVDNTNKEQRMLPEHLNLGVYQTENGGHTVGLTADNHPIGNVFGFSENFFDRLDIIEGETDLSVLKNKLWNGNNVILMGEYDDHGNFAGAESAFYFGLSVGDTIQFYENGTPTKEFTIIAKAAATDGDVTVTGGGSNIAQIIEGPRIFMAENKFKEIYETPTLYGFLFDVEEQYQQEMETYLAQDTDVAYTSILTMKATVSSVKNVVLLIGGMIGAVFALVGLINFINLVMTNIIIRRHEFATMQSIGMTNRQLRKMMISESFSYVLLAGIVGTLAAAVLGITLVRSFVEISPSSIMMTFQMTLLPALVMLILFLALAFIVPVVALRLFNSRSVVERLRVNE
mgnify:CR=1 FL=1